ncbi:MAG: hypothetical protein KU38_00340 [Sulfurovum sp. FS08-3]|nr:MAG: hypothetical protein KU38_00340 [Sulfurovum sp. FS08-3]
MFDSKFKFSVILCSALLLVSCGGGGGDTTTTLPTANDNNVTPNNNTTTTPVNPNEKVVTQENVDIEDAKIVEESIDGVLGMQTLNVVSDNTSAAMAHYRTSSAIAYQHDCLHGGTLNIDTDYSMDGTNGTSYSYSNCSINDYYTMNGTFTTSTDSTNLHAIAVLQEYITDFTMTMPQGMLTIYADSQFSNIVESGAGVYGQAKVISLFSMHSKMNENETIFKDLTIETEAVLQYNEVRICFKEGAIYSSIAPTANPFLIDNSFDPDCNNRFIVNIVTNEITSGEVHYYIGSHKFRTYAFGGELQTERVTD